MAQRPVATVSVEPVRRGFAGTLGWKLDQTSVIWAAKNVPTFEYTIRDQLIKIQNLFTMDILHENVCPSVTLHGSR
jgi:hypothetical protein